MSNPEESTLSIPTIHMNGTSAKNLMEALENTYTAIGAAQDALRETTPNGRDFYPQGNGAIEKAQKEHYSRLQALEAVKKELVVICDGIYKQQRDREAQRA